MKYINNYLVERGIDSTNARSGETFTYIIGECGYLHLENFDSTVADRLYNSFGSEGIKKAIVIVDNKPTLIATDYANRRYISIVITSTINLEEEGYTPSDEEVGEQQLQEESIQPEVIIKKDIVESVNKTESKIVEQINSKIDELNLEQIAEEVDKELKVDKLEKVIVDDSKQYLDEKLADSRASRKKKHSGPSVVAKLGYTVAIMMLLMFISDTINNTKANIQFEEVYTNVVDPDYVFKWDDLISNNSSGGEVLANLEQIELGSGSNYQINQDNLQFSQSDTEVDSELFTVGEDIEPGIYTLKYSGDIGVYVENELNISLFNQDVDYYNIPLGIGSTVEIVRPNFAVGDDYSIELTPQNELVNYEDGLYGLFVYGLTYFDSDLTIDSDQYSVLHSYPYSEFESVFETYSFDSNVSIQGYPGSYISVS